MPKEKRFSNTEMVSLPEGYMLVERSIWTEQQVEAATACITRLKGVHGMRDRDLAMAAIDAAQCKAPDIALADLLPAPQPHPEPIAWMVGTAIWWTKEEAEQDAAATGLPIVGLGPMTDAGEVERLRTERKRMDEALVACADERDELRKANTEFEAQVASDFKFIDDLRAQLGGAHSLLREADEFMYIMTGHDSHARLAHQYGEKWWNAIDKLRGKVCTVLSAGAAPQVKS